MPTNPYAPPATSPLPVAPTVDSHDAPFGIVTEEVVQELERGRPWMRFLAILGFISAGLQVVAAIGLIVIANSGEVPLGSGLALLYLFFAAFYFTISNRLSDSATAIVKIRNGDGPEALARFARSQSSLWRILGMLSLLMVLLMAIVVLVIVQG